jgi:hypothetical protein
VPIETGADDTSLQTSTIDASGTFVFHRPLTGIRIQAMSDGSEWRLPVVRSGRVQRADVTFVEVTPLTTLFDQLLVAGMPVSNARGTVLDLLTSACGADAAAAASEALYADSPLAGKTRYWLLHAIGAYLEAFRNVGLSASGAGMQWASRVSERRSLLMQMCEVARHFDSEEWFQFAKQALAGPMTTAPNSDVLGRISDASRTAIPDVLNLMGLRMIKLEYPDLPENVTRRETWEGQEGALAIRLMEQRLLVARQSPQADSAAIGIDRLGQIVREVHVDAEPLAEAVLRFNNEGHEDRLVRVAVNRTELADIDGVLAQVLAMPVSNVNEPMRQRAWRFVVAQRRHTSPVTGGLFQHQPDLYLRSIGSGLCDDSATVLHWIWRRLGLDSRVVGLNGHVVAEVWAGSRWELYDPDFGIYYFNRNGSVASVDDVANDPDLATRPLALDPRAVAARYDSALIARIYATQDDNVIEPWYSTPTAVPLKAGFTIPAKGYLELTDKALQMVPAIDGSSVNLVPIKLWFPPGYAGIVALPMLLADISGSGQVGLLGNYHDLATDEMSSVISAYYAEHPSIGITSLELRQIGPSGLTITMVGNPRVFDAEDGFVASITASDLLGVSVKTIISRD